jgi:hypothetical protein
MMGWKHQRKKVPMRMLQPFWPQLLYQTVRSHQMGWAKISKTQMLMKRN